MRELRRPLFPIGKNLAWGAYSDSNIMLMLRLARGLRVIASGMDCDGVTDRIPSSLGFVGLRAMWTCTLSQVKMWIACVASSASIFNFQATSIQIRDNLQDARFHHPSSVVMR